MAEFRLNEFTGEWVLISPERSRRPIEPLPESRPRSVRFKGLPVKSFSISGGRDALEFHKHLYPAIQAWTRREQADSRTKHGHGRLLLIKYRSSQEFATASQAHANVFGTAMSDLIDQDQRDARVKFVTLFRNVGQSSGASLSMPHYQYWASSVTSPRDDLERVWLRNKPCPLCAHVRRYPQLIVETRESALLMCPRASRFVSECWIVPMRHVRSFTQLDSDERADILSLLSVAYQRLRRAYRPLALNEVWREWRTRSKEVHFRIELLPRLSRPAGLEMGHGLYVNPVRPEQSASLLRSLRTTKK
jgi:UDPglucose--hexose-1-phosphate uridylyltransferase